jgi:hypothetical protein
MADAKVNRGPEVWSVWTLEIRAAGGLGKTDLELIFSS